jgi:hypothetical protein
MSLLAAACLVCIASAEGQVVPQNHPAPAAGAPRSIVLPRELVSGAPATLSVLDIAGRLVTGVTLETTGGETLHTDATGRAEFLAPAAPGKFIVHVEGQMIATSALVVPAPDPAPDASVSVQLSSTPHVLDIHNRFELAGIGFRGNADDNHIAIGEKQALVLAASPTSVVAMLDPGTPLGAAVLSVGVANQAPPATAAVIVVTLDAIASEGALRVGQQTTFTVRVRGTTEPLAIEVSDLSPAILQLPGGNPLKVTSTGGSNNVAQFEVVPLAVGKYSVRAHLASNE